MTDACLTSKSVVLRDTNGRLESVNKALCGNSTTRHSNKDCEVPFDSCLDKQQDIKRNFIFFIF